MYPTREQALALLAEAEPHNPGPWGDHSRCVAHCAEKIAAACGLNADKAFVLGLLHDIGRRYGKRHLGHVSDGYSYMMQLGYDDVARVCLSHSFNDQSLATYVGSRDTTPEETALIETQLAAMTYDDTTGSSSFATPWGMLPAWWMSKNGWKMSAAAMETIRRTNGTRIWLCWPTLNSWPGGTYTKSWKRTPLTRNLYTDSRKGTPQTRCPLSIMLFIDPTCRTER